MNPLEQHVLWHGNQDLNLFFFSSRPVELQTSTENCTGTKPAFHHHTGIFYWYSRTNMLLIASRMSCSDLSLSLSHTHTHPHSLLKRTCYKRSDFSLGILTKSNGFVSITSFDTNNSFVFLLLSLSTAAHGNNKEYWYAVAVSYCKTAQRFQ